MTSRTRERILQTSFIMATAVVLVLSGIRDVRAQWYSSTLVYGGSTSAEIQLPPPGGPIAAPPCGPKKLALLRLSATSLEDSTVDIDCSFTLPLGHPDITKRLVLTGKAARGIEIDCNGAVIDGGPGTYHYQSKGANMIEVVSRTVETHPVWLAEQPRDITIRRCEVIGSVRVQPLDLWRSSNLQLLAEASRRPGYVARLRANAPTGVRFEKMIFHGIQHSPIYIGTGVTDTSVVDSKFYGAVGGVALYLDVESSRNVIANNEFHVETNREIIAIDGSDHNEIVGNFFSALDHGGVELYRNCGEHRIVRFTTPSHNRIVNNVFYYDKYDGSEAAVVLGSRDGKSRRYCGHDDDFPGGSGLDDRSFATHNIVMQNQIYKRSIEESIKTKWTDVNVPNYVAYNETVSVHEERPSGCYVESAYGQFLRHGETTQLARDADGEPSCRQRALRCLDGELRTDLELLSACEIDQVSFSCRVEGDNRGCNASTICPAGTTRVRTFAACNLEYGSVSTAQLESVDGNGLRVVRPSTRVSDGYCYVGENGLREGETVIEDRGNARVYFGCDEHDANGGDCHLRGELYCQGDGARSTIQLFR